MFSAAKSYGRSALTALAALGMALAPSMAQLPGRHHAQGAATRKAWGEWRQRLTRWGLTPYQASMAMRVLAPPRLRDGAAAAAVPPAARAWVNASPCLCLQQQPRRRGIDFDKAGYARLNLGDGCKVSAHRLVLYLVSGSRLWRARRPNATIPSLHAACPDPMPSKGRDGGMPPDAMHLCGNAACVNWLHLTWGSRLLNQQGHPLRLARLARHGEMASALLMYKQEVALQDEWAGHTALHEAPRIPEPAPPQGGQAPEQQKG